MFPVTTDHDIQSERERGREQGLVVDEDGDTTTVMVHLLNAEFELGRGEERENCRKGVRLERDLGGKTTQTGVWRSHGSGVMPATAHLYDSHHERKETEIEGHKVGF